MGLATGLTSLLILSSLLLDGQAGQARPGQHRDTCDAAARRLFTAAPVRVSGKVKAPKRLRYVNPRYPELPSGTVGSGVWIGEALIGPDGRVTSVEVVRDLKFTPACPAFSKAISDAIVQWRYSPTIVAGKAVPVCMAVSVNINWQ